MERNHIWTRWSGDQSDGHIVNARVLLGRQLATTNQEVCIGNNREVLKLWSVTSAGMEVFLRITPAVLSLFTKSRSYNLPIRIPLDHITIIFQITNVNIFPAVNYFQLMHQSVRYSEIKITCIPTNAVWNKT